MVKRSGRALILRRFAYGESSLVLQVLSREHGRVHLIAKGAFRPTSRYYAALDLFDTLELEWSGRRGSDLVPLSAARILVRRPQLAHDGERYRAALTVLELSGVGAQEERPDGELFDLAEAALDALAAPGAVAQAVLIVFELGFLGSLGLAPALLHCAACGRPAPPAGRAGANGRGSRSDFSAGAGGRLCGACAREARAAGRRVGTLPVQVLEWGAQLAAGGLRSLGPDHCAATLTGLDADGLERTRDFVARFLEYHLEGRPRSYQRLLSVGNRNAAVPER